jgi:preprotein translocase subunit Sss1
MISHALPIQIGIFMFASSVRTTFKPIKQGSNQVNMTKNLNLARKPQKTTFLHFWVTKLNVFAFVGVFGFKISDKVKQISSV